MVFNNTIALLLKVNSTLTSSNTQCADWTPAQHVLYKLANIFLAASFVIPVNFKLYWLLLRSIGATACVFMALWGYHVVCQKDVLGWYFACAILNGFYTIVSLYTVYPAQFDSKLDNLYRSTFKPIKMGRTEYKLLTALGNVTVLPKGAEYCKEGATQLGETVSMLLSGKLKVSHEDTHIHNIQSNQFIDSIEYDSFTRSSTVQLLGEQPNLYQMTVSALEESTIMTWSIGELRMLMMSHPIIGSVFNTIVGKDITLKLYQVQDMLHHVRQEQQMMIAATLPKIFSHSNSLSYMNLLQLDSPSSKGTMSPSPRGTPVISPRETPKESPSSSIFSFTGAVSDQLKIPSPHGTLSISQSSFETCVDL